jgi:hypothetical protein
VPVALEADIQRVALEAVRNPGYTEQGRFSRRVTFGGRTESDTELHRLATQIGDDYLGTKPGPGSFAVISTVTDAVAFNRRTQGSKAASNWHQDFVVTETGFFSPSPDTTRVIIPMLAGPLYAVGKVGVVNAIKIEATTPPDLPDRHAALLAGPTVIGADGVLIKSEEDPFGGEIFEAKPDRVYIMPPSSVHKTNPRLPQGRIFFQLDALRS